MIHQQVAGTGQPAILFVHGFGCASSDWNAQVAHFSLRHQTIPVDLPGHGATPAAPEDCSIEQYGADVAEVMRALALPPAVLVGHSMGCRVVIEAALQAPAHTAGIVLVDGSQFSPAMAPVLQQKFAAPDGYISLVRALFSDMFTARSDPAMAASIAARAERLSPAIGEKMMTDMLRYDTVRLAASLACLPIPVMVLQATYANEKRERRPLVDGQTTPYLDLIRRQVPSARVNIISGTGHFPQLDEPARTNAAIADFLASLAKPQ